MSMSQILSAIAALTLLANTAVGQTLTQFTKRSKVTQPVIIELYTSQGCSSCPPAETWLSVFLNETELWHRYFPLAFHVTYWDYLGWKDPYGQRKFSQRQYDHLNQTHIKQLYTPQFVINGVEWQGWFDKKLGDVLTPPKRPVGVLDVSISGNQLTARFSSLPSASAASRLHLALVGAGITTVVKHGENRHKSLKHDFTVLSFQTYDANKLSRDEFSGEVVLPSDLMKRAERLAWVAWIEQEGQAVQAVGDWLAPSVVD